MSEMICGKTALEETMCMIEAALRDIKATYRETGGGGISEIKFLETKTLMISIAQEERVDQITYAFDIKANRRLVLLRRTEGTKSPRR